jgi:hypothetical protein
VPSEEEFLLEMKTFPVEAIMPRIAVPVKRGTLRGVRMSTQVGTHIEFPYQDKSACFEVAQFRCDPSRSSNAFASLLFLTETFIEEPGNHIVRFLRFGQIHFHNKVVAHALPHMQVGSTPAFTSSACACTAALNAGFRVPEIRNVGGNYASTA